MVKLSRNLLLSAVLLRSFASALVPREQPHENDLSPRDYTRPCTTTATAEEESATLISESGNVVADEGPVTVTVTLVRDGSSFITLPPETTTSTSESVSSTSSSSTSTSTTANSTTTSGSSTAVPEAASTSSTEPLNLVQQNAFDAQQLNLRFQTLRSNRQCTAGERACVEGQLAQCSDSSSQWVAVSCGIFGEVCVAVPDLERPGTHLRCMLPDQAARIFAQTGTDPGIDLKSGASIIKPGGSLAAITTVAFLSLSLLFL